MSFNNLSSNHGLQELGTKAVKLEQHFVRGSQQNVYPQIYFSRSEESKSLSRGHCIEENMSASLNVPNIGASVANRGGPSVDNSTLCSTSSISPAPICRQFWKAGNYNDRLISKPPSLNGTGHVHIHPKFLHSNATSHKWAFGAIAELVDNAVDEIRNGAATFVNVDKTANPRDGNTALLIQDDGGGMTPEAMRCCLSFGFSDKKSKNAIGQYGNGFKTSSMRLGADVIVFSRSKRNRKSTQSVGLLSYTFLMQTRQDRILVPMVDYQFDSHSGKWTPIHSEEQHNSNLSILLQWSPFATTAELLKQCDETRDHGTRIIIYNLWHDDVGKLELDFESDPGDICISKGNNNQKVSSKKETTEHLAFRIHYSLRAYLSILYLKIEDNFCIILRGQVVEFHSIANDLKFPEFILYRPHNAEGQILTTIGFVKEAPDVNVHGFNVYHKNRLILPFWHVVAYSTNRGRGVVGVLEANFIQPTHNKQDFEKTPVFLKLAARLKEMTLEYWDYHCGLIGYQVTKNPRPNTTSYAQIPAPSRQPNAQIPAPSRQSNAQIPAPSKQPNSIFKPVVLTKNPSDHVVGAKAPSAVSSSRHQVRSNQATKEYSNPMGALIEQFLEGPPSKRKAHAQSAEPKKIRRTETTATPANNSDGGVVEVVGTVNQDAAAIIQENKRLKAQCEEYEKQDEELNQKVTRLTEEVKGAQREYARLLLESKILERVEQNNRGIKSV
ncbi:protein MICRORCHIDIA 6 [Andrographis paniculata]|uniref:protein MICRORCHIDIA 6 n=1 Tax=Andrographis paniculata TaxID=175694 RepID=UPI0021E96E94|nr:protein MICRORCHIDIA 6 [Andrographis paniculata]